MDGPESAEPRAVAAVIDDYVREALRSNLSLRAEGLVLERSLAALDAARAHFLPTLAFDARYTRAEGGRQLELPVGTLLNPVYSTLNQLLVAQGRPAEFAAPARSCWRSSSSCAMHATATPRRAATWTSS